MLDRILDWVLDLLRFGMYVWWVILAGVFLIGGIYLFIFLFRAEKEYQCSSPTNKLERYFLIDFIEGIWGERLFYSGFLFTIILALDSYLLGNFLTGLLDYDFHEFFWLLLVLPFIYIASSLIAFVLGAFWIICRTIVYVLGDLIYFFINFFQSTDK